MGTSGLEAAMLVVPLPVQSYSIPVNSIGLLDPENMGVAFEISFLSLIRAEICGGGTLPQALHFLVYRFMNEPRFWRFLHQKVWK